MADLLINVPNLYEPKRNNRFILRFPSDLGINEWIVTTAQRPKQKINSVEIPLFNTSQYVAGRFNWEAISVKFIDPIGPSTTQAIMEWSRLHAESVTGRMGYAVGYKKDVELVMTDPTGVEVEKWILEGCFITDLDFGDLDYSDDALATVSATLRMDRCVLVY